MAHAIPTPKWELAPYDVREAWHSLKNTTMSLMALQRQAQHQIEETAHLLEEADHERSEKH